MKSLYHGAFITGKYLYIFLHEGENVAQKAKDTIWMYTSLTNKLEYVNEVNNS